MIEFEVSNEQITVTYQVKFLDEYIHEKINIDISDFWDWVIDNEYNLQAIWPTTAENNPGIQDIALDFDEYIASNPVDNIIEYINLKIKQK